MDVAVAVVVETKMSQVRDLDKEGQIESALNVSSRQCLLPAHSSPPQHRNTLDSLSKQLALFTLLGGTAFLAIYPDAAVHQERQDVKHTNMNEGTL